MNTVSYVESPVPVSSLVLRGVVGGTLMGLANLVPGISGGTMLLAVGIYPLFILAIAEASTLKLRPASLAVLASVGAAALLSILVLAGTVKDLVVDHRWVMYSIFIGLTLGGLPVVWRIARPATRATWLGAVAGFGGMAIIALLQQADRQRRADYALLQQAGVSGGGEGGSGVTMLFAAGLVGAAAMILPGISGGYLLLVMGQYVPILSAVDRFKEALRTADWAGAFDVGLHVLTPVGVGVVLGIVGVSQVLKILLKRYEKATLGVLLGLLVGAVVGLWPFQVGRVPEIGETLKGRPVTVERLSELGPEDYPVELFRPAAVQVAGAVGLIAMGFLATMLLSRLDGRKDGARESASRPK
ncbi:MAG: DUF368 domain-containing protein [Thermoanaerobaculia bacterium]|nr:DUF368 domain-containing protein [Thermoanaerobaculia bacterium]